MKRNIKVTVEKWELVNPFNKQLLDKYIFECDINGLAKTSIRTYNGNNKMFLVWVLDNKENINVTELQKRDFQEYAKYLRDENKSTSTHNDYISSVKNMMEFAEDDDETNYNRNMCSKLKGLKIKRIMKKTYLTDEQINKLYNELVKRKKYKWASYLIISYESTGRVSEIIQIEKSVFMQGEEARNNTNFLHKKGYSEPSPLLFFKRTKEIVPIYLEQRGSDNINSLWIGINKKASTVGGAEYWCSQMSKILSEIESKDIRFTPHDLRRSSIENYHNATHYLCEVRIQHIPYTIQDIQLLANHKDPTTTEGYLKNNKEKNLENAFDIKIIN